MKLPFSGHRLLPLTIAVMAALLAVKSVALVRAAAPGGDSGAARAADLAAKPAAATTPRPAASAVPEARPARAAPARPTAAPAASPPAEPPISEGERALLLDLRQRRAELDARAAALAERENVLAAAEARLNARLDELSDLQKRLESLDAARRDHEEANWRGLVRLYESMKPRDAGAIFNDLDLPVLLPILDRMKEAKAAAILSAMQPERARLVTAELAQMRAHATTVPPASPGNTASNGAATSAALSDAATSAAGPAKPGH